MKVLRQTNNATFKPRLLLGARNVLVSIVIIACGVVICLAKSTTTNAADSLPIVDCSAWSSDSLRSCIKNNANKEVVIDLSSQTVTIAPSYNGVVSTYELEIPSGETVDIIDGNLNSANSMIIIQQGAALNFGQNVQFTINSGAGVSNAGILNFDAGATVNGENPSSSDLYANTSDNGQTGAIIYNNYPEFGTNFWSLTQTKAIIGNKIALTVSVPDLPQILYSSEPGAYSDLSRYFSIDNGGTHLRCSDFTQINATQYTTDCRDLLAEKSAITLSFTDPITGQTQTIPQKVFVPLSNAYGTIWFRPLDSDRLAEGHSTFLGDDGVIYMFVDTKNWLKDPNGNDYGDIVLYSSDGLLKGEGMSCISEAENSDWEGSNFNLGVDYGTYTCYDANNNENYALRTVLDSSNNITGYNLILADPLIEFSDTVSPTTSSSQSASSSPIIPSAPNTGFRK